MSDTIRLEVNIAADTARQLNDLAALKGITVTNVVRRAVGVYAHLYDELDDPAKSLQIVDRAKPGEVLVITLT